MTTAQAQALAAHLSRATGDPVADLLELIESDTYGGAYEEAYADFLAGDFGDVDDEALGMESFRIGEERAAYGPANSAAANGIQTRGGKREAHPLDFWRLRDKAEAKGIKLHRAEDPGCFIAESASRPGLTHHVDVELGCSCEGFASHARCMHYAAALSALGMLPDWPDDEPPAPAGPSAAQPAASETSPSAADYEAAAAYWRDEAAYARRNYVDTGWSARDAQDCERRATEAAAAAQYAEWAGRAENQTAPWETAQAVTAAEQGADDEHDRRSAAARKGVETRRRNKERTAAAAAAAEAATGIPVRQGAAGIREGGGGYNPFAQGLPGLGCTGGRRRFEIRYQNAARRDVCLDATDEAATAYDWWASYAESGHASGVYILETTTGEHYSGEGPRQADGTSVDVALWELTA